MASRLINTALVASLLVLSLGMSSICLAQDHKEDRKLVMGSVYRVVRNLIEVKEEGSDISVIKIDAATKYINSSTQAPAKLKDIGPGDQVVVKVVVKNGVDTAEQVKFIPALGAKN